jgi:TM2 domain-containing membrane protein YozV
MRNKSTTAILALFLGGFGIHRFYLGQTGKGIVSILFCWTLIPSLIGLIDFFAFLSMSNFTFDSKYNNAINTEVTNFSKKCALCSVDLKSVNTPTFNSGRLNDGNELCTSCFKKVNNVNPSVAFKLKKYVLADIKNLFEDKESVENRLVEFKNRPLPKSEIKTISVPKDEIIEDFDLPYDVSVIKLNTLAYISYTDNAGQKSERRITMKTIQPTYDNDYLIIAYCHEKEAQRSFKLSRIDRLVDIETGEIFTEPIKYFLERFNNSPLGQITKRFQDLEPEILILSYIARADGYLRKQERVIIANFIQNGYDTILDESLLEDEIRKTYCESSDLRKSLKIVSKKTESEKIQLYNHACQIVESDKKSDPIEIGILELIKKELKF